MLPGGDSLLRLLETIRTRAAWTPADLAELGERQDWVPLWESATGFDWSGDLRWSGDRHFQVFVKDRAILAAFDTTPCFTLTGAVIARWDSDPGAAYDTGALGGADRCPTMQSAAAPSEDDGAMTRTLESTDAV